jgi:hypothetical protein
MNRPRARTTPAPKPGGIGTLGEFGLHAGLKRWYAQPGDQFEVALDGYVIDIRRGDMLIEIQTRGFGAMRRKLATLAERYAIRIVHPIAERKWIVRARPGSDAPTRRRSPKPGRIEAIFDELVSIPDLVAHPNISFDVALIEAEEVLRPARARARRRKGWRVADRRLVAVNRVVPFADAEDFAALLPVHMARPFTARALAEAAAIPLRLAYRMAYCLARMGAIATVGKRHRARLYDLAPVKTRSSIRR